MANARNVSFSKFATRFIFLYQLRVSRQRSRTVSLETNVFVYFGLHRFRSCKLFPYTNTIRGYLSTGLRGCTSPHNRAALIKHFRFWSATILSPHYFTTILVTKLFLFSLATTYKLYSNKVYTSLVLYCL